MIILFALFAILGFADSWLTLHMVRGHGAIELNPLMRWFVKNAVRCYGVRIGFLVVIGYLLAHAAPLLRSILLAVIILGQGYVTMRGLKIYRNAHAQF